MKKYFIRFVIGTQCKNKAQTKIFLFIKSYDGTLVYSTEQLIQLTTDIQIGIANINAEFPRCTNVSVSVILDRKKGATIPSSIWVGQDHICSLHIHEIIIDKNQPEGMEWNTANIQILMNTISKWSDDTFGSHSRNPGIVFHLKKEVDELISAINEVHRTKNDTSKFGNSDKVLNMLFEYADCFMLLLDSAAHENISADSLFKFTMKKLEINKLRKWGKPDENGVCEHIKERSEK